MNDAGSSGAGPTLKVQVLAGGPDSEHDVSLESGRNVADALKGEGFDVTMSILTDPASFDPRAVSCDVVFPALHGGWGEGGPLQGLLEDANIPFVGSGSTASRLAMDKIATKTVAAAIGVPCPMHFVLDTRDDRCPMPFPVVVKPVHEGSTIGLHVVHDAASWSDMLRELRDLQQAGTARVYMVEPFINGRELTIGLLDNKALPLIEIVPAEGLYDYEAKYQRDDTQYRFDPELPDGLEDRLGRLSEDLANRCGVRHLGRVDFMLDADGEPWLLEINTIPGFTTHSLVPMAARHAGIEMGALCGRLVRMGVGEGVRE